MELISKGKNVKIGNCKMDEYDIIVLLVYDRSWMHNNDNNVRLAITFRATLLGTNIRLFR